MRCADCRWYKLFGTESSDQCLHEKSESRIGGVRSEFVVTHLSCEAALMNRCENHKLFEPLPMLRYEYPDKHAGLKADAVRAEELANEAREA